MSNSAAGRGLKRPVSSATAVAAIVAAIALIIVLALVVPKLIGPKPDLLAPNLPQGAVKQILGERLGASLTPKLSEQGIEGLQVTQVPPGAAGGLQVGDVITSINGKKLGTSLPDMVRATDSVKVGQTMPVEVTRGGTTTLVQVTRGESTPIEEMQKQGGSGPSGMLGGLAGGRRGGR